MHPNPYRRAGRRGDLIQGDGPTINRAGLTTCAAGILHRRLVHEGRPHVRSGGSFPHRHYDNALAESVIGLYKTEVIRKDDPWKGVDDVEFATLDWVPGFNEQRLLGPIGDIPPAEFEQMYYQQQQSRLVEAGLN